MADKGRMYLENCIREKVISSLISRWYGTIKYLNLIKTSEVMLATLTDIRDNESKKHPARR